jgi:putative membrane-bound dehydrogenase-like protein
MYHNGYDESILQPKPRILMRKAVAHVSVSLLLGTLVSAAFTQQIGLPTGVKNTQNPKDVPPTPEEAVRLFHPASGFHVTLFAGEPNVCQPIAMAFDDRGRLWVAECYSYPNWSKDGTGNDRILILEDTDGDGKFDKRTVFYDKASNLTGIVLGKGGVWACCAPNLIFIPDRNGDDVPDGPPEVVLDGWSLKSGHNMYNGLMWGPDGWLYGRHGILADSLVGRPGTPEAQRVRLNCAIWRYHPGRKAFEAVAHGTTNPWGMDFDEHGEAFFTNCVIGHLWHLIPGAHYQRMYGRDFNPFAYELIGATSDHLHWGGGDWTSSRGGQGVHNEAGGGHAHVGGMVYLGDNWPDEFRNNIFMVNLHGNRLNRDLLVRHGASYVGKHAADFLRSDNPWFRGIDLIYGPDGGVFVSDWCDFGECHDNDGVHRSSGRIYKVFHGKPASVAGLDLAKKSDDELVRLQLHRNDWYVRHGRRLLTERAEDGKPMRHVHAGLQRIYEKNPDVTRKLRAMWTLYTTGGAGTAWLRKQLDHGDGHVRSWAIRLLCDGQKPDGDTLLKFTERARNDESGLVRLYLAAALQRVVPGERFAIARNLAEHAEDERDRCQPLMIWYGIEPAVAAHASKALEMAAQSKIPKLRQFIARRLAEAAGQDGAGLEPIVELVARTDKAAAQRDLVVGLRDGLKGRKSVPMPKSWEAAYPQLARSELAKVREAADALGLLFNDKRAVDHLRRTLVDVTASAGARQSALQAFSAQGNPELVPVLFKLLEEPAMRGSAIRALATYQTEQVPKIILGHYKGLTAAEKQDAITTLSSRPSYALALLDAIAGGKLPRTDITAFTARQLKDLGDKRISARLGEVWGQLRQTSAEKKALIAKYQAMLTPEVLGKADPANGRLVFNRTCFQCHALFGAGNKIGPDLTGSNRSELYYVLENMIDPSAVIGNDYRLTNIVTDSGRLISGIIVEETGRAVTVQTATERLVVPKGDIETRRESPVSMMPEGQIEQMSFTELRDLIGYLRSKKQVPLPR